MSVDGVTEMLSWVILTAFVALLALIVAESRFPEAWQMYQNGTHVCAPDDSGDC